MAFNSPIEIPAPKPERLTGGLFVDVATPLTPDEAQGDRWRSGVTFVPYGTDALTRYAPDLCDDDAIGTPFDTEACPTFLPFGIYGAELGSALDWDIDMLSARVDARFTTMVSEQFTKELFESTESPSFNEVAEVSTGGAIDFLEALSAIESVLAIRLHGGKGIVWVQPGALAAISYTMNFIDGQFYTPSGHLVASDPGLVGQTPNDETPSATSAWIYGSGPVKFTLGRPRETKGNAEEYLDRTTNKLLALRTHDAIVAFDPLTVSAAEGTFAPGS